MQVHQQLQQTTRGTEINMHGEILHQTCQNPYPIPAQYN